MSSPMTPTEQDNELRALLGEMPYFVIDWLELSDDLRHEWKKGGKASDFGGHRTFIQKYEKKLADFITADRKRVALEARIEQELTAHTNAEIAKVLDRLAEQSRLQDYSHGTTDSWRVRRMVEAIEAERNKLRENK